MSEMEEMYQLLKELKKTRRANATAAELWIDACEERDAMRDVVDMLVSALQYYESYDGPARDVLAKITTDK